MLVLSRKLNERIVIGSNIEVVVLSVCGNRVRLGVVAPDEVPIRRDELLRRTEGGNPRTAFAKRESAQRRAIRQPYTDANRELPNLKECV